MRQLDMCRKARKWTKFLAKVFDRGVSPTTTASAKLSWDPKSVKTVARRLDWLEREDSIFNPPPRICPRQPKKGEVFLDIININLLLVL